MKLFAFDTETYRFNAHCRAPKLVCVSTMTDTAASPSVFNAVDGVAAIRAALEDPDTRIIGHNISYDLMVLVTFDPSLWSAVLTAMEQNRVSCTLVRERLSQIAQGINAPKGFNTLQNIAKRYCGMFLEKGEVRTNYESVDGLEVSQWPQEYVDYAALDALATLKVWQAQSKAAHTEVFPQENFQVRVAFTANYIGCQGVEIDRPKALDIFNRLEDVRIAARDKLLELGFVTIKKHRKTPPTYHKATKRLRELAERCGVTRDPQTGKLEVNKKTKELLALDHPEFAALAAMENAEKHLSFLTAPLEVPEGKRLNCSYSTLKNTGRWSCSGPNLQQIPAHGKMRNIFKAAKGKKLIIIDFNQIELCALAFILMKGGFGTIMLDAINSDKDLHCVTGAKLYGTDYDSFKAMVKEGGQHAIDCRQLAKAANFGFAGGMCSYKTFRLAAAKYGISITEDEFQRTLMAWLDTWQDVDAMMTKYRYATYPRQIKHLSGRYQLVDRHSAAVNNLFQGAVADGMGLVTTHIMWEIEKAGASLHGRGIKMVMMVHDELVFEVPEADAEALKVELSDIMLSQMRRVLPDVKLKTAAAISDCWLGKDG